MDALHYELERKRRILAEVAPVMQRVRSQWDLTLDKTACAFLGCASPARHSAKFCFTHRSLDIGGPVPDYRDGLEGRYNLGSPKDS